MEPENMSELNKFLKSLISAPGLSGFEAPVRDLIRAAWEPLTDEIGVSRLGSLHARVNGSAPEPRPALLLAAHMDAIGLMVSAVQQGFLRLTGIGGLDARVLPGQVVRVHGREELPGVVVQPPGHLLPSKTGDGPVPLEYLLVDVGLLPEKVEQLVRVGDLVSFDSAPLEMGADVFAGHSLDNRASVAAVTHCLQELRSYRHAWDIWAVATTQEEATLGGALTSAYALQPDLAVAIDVTFGSSPGSPSHKTFPMGKGITLGWGPNVHSGVFRVFQELAERLEIPYQVEVMPRHSGTDAYGLQIARAGIPTMVVSIPLRYMHTPVEVISMKDITRAGRLLAAFAASLEIDFLQNLSWDE
jgi:tetrahedral aminopeptidase